MCGASVAEAFDDLYYLERACRVQILAQSTGKELSIVSDETALGFKEDCANDAHAEEGALYTSPLLSEGVALGPGHIFCT